MKFKSIGWARIWLITSIIWCSWFLYQGITAATELNYARAQRPGCEAQLKAWQSDLAKAEGIHDITFKQWIISHDRRGGDKLEKEREDIAWFKSCVTVGQNQKMSLINLENSSEEIIRNSLFLGLIGPIVTILLYSIIFFICKGFTADRKHDTERTFDRIGSDSSYDSESLITEISKSTESPGCDSIVAKVDLASQASQPASTAMFQSPTPSADLKENSGYPCPNCGVNVSINSPEGPFANILGIWVGLSPNMNTNTKVRVILKEENPECASRS